MKKKQLHEALAVLLTKLSSARDNPLLMDNYVVKALRTVLLEYKESGELHEAYKEQIQSTLESDTSTKRATSSTACHTRRQQRHSWEPVGTWHTFPSTATTSRNS